MITIRLPLQDIVIDPIRDVDLAALPEEEATLTLMQAYRFLAPEIAVTLENGVATIMAETGHPEQRQEAQRLLERALKHARQGHYDKAIPLLQQALANAPDWIDIRRNLAMAYLESGQKDKAKTTLVETLRVDPRDAWSNLLLGNILAKHEKDLPHALKWYRNAYEVDPHDAILLTNIGATLVEQGEREQAAEYFERAIESNPQYPNPHYALALLHVQNTAPDQALARLDQLFAQPQPADVRSNPLLNEARKLYLKASQQSADQHHDELLRFVDERKEQLAEKTGFRIDLVADPMLKVSAMSQMAWRHQRDYHLIRYQSKKPAVVPHLLAHELEHLALEQAARQSGRNRSFMTTAATRADSIRAIQDDIDRLQRLGVDEASLTTAINSMVEGVAIQLYNIPLDMIIEHHLFERDAVLRSSQFVSLHEQQVINLEVLTNSQIRQRTPARIYKANLAMNCAYALFMDSLYGEKTQYAAPYRNSNAYATGQRLFKIWQDSLGVFEAGDEYILVDEFARELKLQRWYEWKTDAEAALEATNRPEGLSNPELLHRKDQMAVWFLVDALERFETMTAEEVREVAVEIALIGVNGIDYTSAEQKYTLRALPGEHFSGLQLLCLMYVGFKQIDPTADTTIDLHAPYAEALDLYRRKAD
jgi:Tfp pilus assembly protein PilF